MPTATRDAVIPERVEAPGKEIFEVIVRLLVGTWLAWPDLEGGYYGTRGTIELERRAASELTEAIMALYRLAFGEPFRDDLPPDDELGTMAPLYRLALDRARVREVAQLRLEAVRQGRNPFPALREEVREGRQSR